MADALEARRQYRGPAGDRPADGIDGCMQSGRPATAGPAHRGNLDPRFDQFGTGAVRIGVSLRDGNADRDVFDVGCVRWIIGKPLSTSRM